MADLKRANLHRKSPTIPKNRSELALCLSDRFQRASDLTADAHGYGKHFIVRAEEKLIPFVELESAIRACGE